MGVLSNLYLLDKSQFIDLILNGSFQSKGETITFDHLGVYYITGPISSEMIDAGEGATKKFPSPAQILLWNQIPEEQLDWNQTDSTAVDYIKNKPTVPLTFPVTDVLLNAVSTLSNNKSLLNLSSYVNKNRLKTVENQSLVEDGNNNIVIDEINYFDEEPQSDADTNYLRFVLLDEAPSEKHEGYIYLYPESEVENGSN